MYSFELEKQQTTHFDASFIASFPKAHHTSSIHTILSSSFLPPSLSLAQIFEDMSMIVPLVKSCLSKTIKLEISST